MKKSKSVGNKLPFKSRDDFCTFQAAREKIEIKSTSSNETFESSTEHIIWIICDRFLKMQIFTVLRALKKLLYMHVFLYINNYILLIIRVGPILFIFKSLQLHDLWGIWHTFYFYSFTLEAKFLLAISILVWPGWIWADGLKKNKLGEVLQGF